MKTKKETIAKILLMCKIENIEPDCKNCKFQTVTRYPFHDIEVENCNLHVTEMYEMVQSLSCRVYIENDVLVSESFNNPNNLKIRVCEDFKPRGK